MTDNNKSNSEYEALSALLDNEASEVDVHRALKLVETDSAARERLQRYQIVSAGLKGETLSPSRDLSSSIWAALDQDESPEFNESSRGWLAGRFAVAASVAAAVVLGAQFWNSDPSQPAANTLASYETLEMDVPSGYGVPLSARTVSNTLNTQSVAVRPPVSQEEFERRLQLLLIEQARRAELERMQRESQAAASLVE